MKSRILITALLIVVSNASYSSDGKTVKESLVGFWHIIPDMPSGWAETYTFNSDGTYIYHTNTMQCSRRLLSIKGEWSHSDNTLTITQKEKEHLVGGKFEKSYGSCFDENELVGAIRAVTEINPNIVETSQLSEIEHDSRFETTLANKITIHGNSYWKFSDGPNYRH